MAFSEPGVIAREGMVMIAFIKRFFMYQYVKYVAQFLKSIPAFLYPFVILLES